MKNRRFLFPHINPSTCIQHILYALDTEIIFLLSYLWYENSSDMDIIEYFKEYSQVKTERQEWGKFWVSVVLNMFHVRGTQKRGDGFLISYKYTEWFNMCKIKN